MDKLQEKKFILSSAVRQYRNVDGINFVPKLAADDADDINFSVKNALTDIWGENGFASLDVNRSDRIDLLRWCERNHCALNIAETAVSRFAFTDNSDTNSVVTNEAEHVMVQSECDCLDLNRCFKSTGNITDALSRRIPFAESPNVGYITSNPLLSGRALKASVTVHIPALTLSPAFSSFFEKMSKQGIIVKGANVENNKNFGAFWLLASEYTRGVTDEEILESVTSAANELCDLEDDKRSFLIGKKRQFVYDTVWRAFSTLATSRLLPMKEFIICMSNLRLGAELEIFDIPLETVDETLLLGSAGYITFYAKCNSLSEGLNNDYIRARIMREEFAPLLKSAL